MSDMMECFVKKIMDSQIKRKYPHLQYPSGMYARVVRAERSGDVYKYTLKILDKNLRINDEFSEIPNVKSEINLHKGDVAVVLLMYGGHGFHILGRCET